MGGEAEGGCELHQPYGAGVTEAIPLNAEEAAPGSEKAKEGGTMTKKLVYKLKDAVKDCQNMWDDIKASGLSKADFLDTARGKEWHSKGYENDCPLCHYADQFKSFCDNCPIFNHVDEDDLRWDCYHYGFDEDPPSASWFELVKSL